MGRGLNTAIGPCKKCTFSELSQYCTRIKKHKSFDRSEDLLCLLNENKIKTLDSFIEMEKVEIFYSHFPNRSAINIGADDDNDMWPQ